MPSPWVLSGVLRSSLWKRKELWGLLADHIAESTAKLLGGKYCLCKLEIKAKQNNHSWETLWLSIVTRRQAGYKLPTMGPRSTAASLWKPYSWCHWIVAGRLWGLARIYWAGESKGRVSLEGDQCDTFQIPVKKMWYPGRWPDPGIPLKHKKLEESHKLMFSDLTRTPWHCCSLDTTLWGLFFRR